MPTRSSFESSVRFTHSQVTYTLSRVPLPLLLTPLQSGIDVTDELLNLYEEVKLRHKHKYFVFSLKQTGGSATKTTWDWEVNHKADAVSDDKNLQAYSEMVKLLPTDEARFIIFDFSEMKSDGRQIKKLLLIKWYVACRRAQSVRARVV